MTRLERIVEHLERAQKRIDVNRKEYSSEEVHTILAFMERLARDAWSLDKYTEELEGRE